MPASAEELLRFVYTFNGDFTAYLAFEEECVQHAKALPVEEQVRFVLSAARLMKSYQTGNETGAPLAKPVSAVLRRKLPFTEDQILELLRLGENPSYYFPFAGVLTLAESLPPSVELRNALKRMRHGTALDHGTATNHKQFKERIDAMLGSGPVLVGFEKRGPWSIAIGADLDRLAADEPAWRELLEAGRDIKGSEPSKKWMEAARQRVESIGIETFRERSLAWLRLGPTPGRTDAQVDSKEVDCHIGLLWSLATFGDRDLCGAVASFAEQCLRKIPMIGAVSARGGNACVRVLAAMPGMEPVSQLSRLSTRVRYQTAQRLVQEALESAAKSQGLTREELEEITVPAYGLDARGERREQIAGVDVVLTARGQLSFFAADGKPLKSVPARLKEAAPAELKEWRQTAKEIEKMHAAQRIRVERLLMGSRWIPFERWLECYIHHPLVSGYAQRLIWELPDGATAFWHEGGLTNWRNQPIETTEKIRLWHPMRADIQTIMNWRAWLEDHAIQQPFKQAHREVYLLTDAERNTAVYSHRFAAHIVRQHQFSALCEQRGWRFRLMGQWDSHNNPTLEIPQFGMRAEFHVDFPADEAITAHGIYLYLATDQVAFYKTDSQERLALESIDPVLFSEVMRDVDLFVAVTSIGADPTWGTNRHAAFQHYWENQAFGELTESAEIRRQTLSALIPKLSIRDRCTLDGRYLSVRGNLATYKIHLGSGNVLMEPGSRYLCIVRGAAGSVPSNVRLPFEGDDLLSLILSKAILLAADDRIKDPSIVQQLPAHQ